MGSSWNKYQMRSVTLFALPIAPVLEVCEKYIFGDWEFVRFLVVLVLLDTILGFVKHGILHDISSKAFGMIAKKLVVYASVLVVTHVLATFSVGGEQVGCLVWFRYFACAALMVREAISIVENCETISPGLLPKSLIRRLSEFDSTTGQRIVNQYSDNQK